MRHIAKPGPLGLVILLAVLQAGCLSETDPFEPLGECGPRDLTPECCLKENPWNPPFGGPPSEALALWERRFLE